MTKRIGAFLLAGLFVALLLAGVVSFYASGAPDGLNRVAADKGFSEQERDHEVGGPLADYAVSGVNDERLSGALAGVIGVTVTFVVAGGVAWAVKRRPTGEPTGVSAGG